MGREDALSRLEGIAQEALDDTPKSTYTLEEQMTSAQENEDIFSEMSAESKDALLSSTGIQEVTLDTPEPEVAPLVMEGEAVAVDTKVPEAPSVTQPSQEGLFNNNKKKSRAGRPRKETTVQKESAPQQDNSSTKQYDPIMSKLANDIIDDLRKSGYSLYGFNKNQMQIVFDYMQDKF